MLKYVISPYGEPVAIVDTDADTIRIAEDFTLSIVSGQKIVKEPGSITTHRLSTEPRHGKCGLDLKLLYPNLDSDGRVFYINN